MLKWFKKLTKKSRTAAKAGKRGNKNRILNELTAQLAGISGKVADNTVHIHNNAADIAELQKDVSTIGATVARLSATLQNATPASPGTLPTHLTTLGTEDFTQLQEATLIILWKLAGRDSGQWIAMKSLVKAIYPDQEYNRVRTTIFEYARIFEELGMIQRLKRGNRTYLALTKKGAETVKQRVAARKESRIAPKIEA